MPEWVKKGWIPDYRTGFIFDKQIFSKLLYQNLIAEIERYTDGKLKFTRAQVDADLNSVIETARRNSPYLSGPRCEGLFH